METTIMILSWLVPILIGLIVVSAPVDLVLSKVRKDWKGSKEANIYRLVQIGGIILWVALVGALIVLIL